MKRAASELPRTVARLMHCVAVLAGGMAISASAHAGFVEFVIRGAPTINHPQPGQTEFVLVENGQKAALGSSDIDGRTLGSLQSVAITRLDDVTRFTAGSGPAVAPYLNFWITDGNGNFAVAANEPSNPEMNGLYNQGYDLSFEDLKNLSVKIYENSDKSWLPNGGVGLSFADLAAFTIQAPTAAMLSIGWDGLGSGAPRELGSNLAYGVNWVFGDTLSNYVSGQTGYLVANASVSAAAEVPEPGSILLAGIGIAAAIGARRRRNR